MTIEDDLHTSAPIVRNLGSPFTMIAKVMRDAADELIRLRSEVVGLRLNLETAIAGEKMAYDRGLDRAGHIAHNHGQYSMAYVEDEPPPDVVTHNHACWAIRDAIRAEKSGKKQ